MRSLRSLLLLVLGLALLSGPVAAQADAATAKSSQRARCAIATKKIKKAKTVRAKAAARRAARRACRKPAKRPTATRPAATTSPTGSSTPAAAPATAPAASTVALSALEEGVVACTNRERVAAGLQPLAVSAVLTRSARAHAADMSARNYFSHTSLDGRTPWDRIRAALDGAQGFGTMGENIASGYRTAEAVCEGWMNSPGHRANILERDFEYIGVGWVDGYAVQNFGAR